MSISTIAKFFKNSDLKDITNNNTCWATLKTFLSNKIKSTEYNTSKENGKNCDKEVARIFLNIVLKLKINTNHDFLINAEKIGG